jgi:CRISPR-associated protein Cmr4
MQQAYGIIETLAPLHVGATAGEESGNLNLIFRDQFTQTGIIPGSSIRGRLRADGRDATGNESDELKDLFGRPAEKDADLQFESQLKFEYASIVWLPVFCPGQPIVWVSCPRLLLRYQRITGKPQGSVPKPYTASRPFTSPEVKNKNKIFFTFGYVDIKDDPKLKDWFPKTTFANGDPTTEVPLLVVDDNEISVIHEMALYRQSRVALELNQKVVAGNAFFNVEALPEGTVLIFPLGVKDPKKWGEFSEELSHNIYLGGLESVGFGHCQLDFYDRS